MEDLSQPAADGLVSHDPQKVQGRKEKSLSTSSHRSKVRFTPLLHCARVGTVRVLGHRVLGRSGAGGCFRRDTIRVLALEVQCPLKQSPRKPQAGGYIPQEFRAVTER